MNIQLGETDELSQIDGQAKNIILTIEGKRMIVPLDKPLSWLVELSEKIGNKAPVVLGGGGPQRPAESRPGETINTLIEMQRNDTVKFLGFMVDGVRTESEDNSDLVMNGLYKVIETDGPYVHIVNPDSDFPIRMTAYKSDFVIVEKGQRVTHVKRVFEMTSKCSGCNKDMALEKQPEGNYSGTCPVCNTVNVSPVQ